MSIQLNGCVNTDNEVVFFSSADCVTDACLEWEGLHAGMVKITICDWEGVSDIYYACVEWDADIWWDGHEWWERSDGVFYVAVPEDDSCCWCDHRATFPPGCWDEPFNERGYVILNFSGVRSSATGELLDICTQTQCTSRFLGYMEFFYRPEKQYLYVKDAWRGNWKFIWGNSIDPTEGCTQVMPNSIEIGDCQEGIIGYGGVCKVVDPCDPCSDAIPWTNLHDYFIGDVVTMTGQSFCYTSQTDHLSGADTQPGYGVDWEDHWRRIRSSDCPE